MAVHELESHWFTGTTLCRNRRCRSPDHQTVRRVGPNQVALEGLVDPNICHSKVRNSETLQLGEPGQQRGDDA